MVRRVGMIMTSWPFSNYNRIHILMSMEFKEMI